jgi:hypothetical protein
MIGIGPAAELEVANCGFKLATFIVQDGTYSRAWVNMATTFSAETSGWMFWQDENP